jgi:hypothetical protein
MLAEALGGAGLAVLRPAEVAPVWQRVVQEMGGVYDRVTGREIPERMAEARRAALLALDGRADLLLKVRIGVVAADVKSEKARWDGAEMGIGAGEVARVPALSLVVSTAGTDGNVIHCARAGVTSLVTWRGLRGKPKAIELDKVKPDDVRLRDAVRRAVATLVAGAPTCTPDQQRSYQSAADVEGPLMGIHLAPAPVRSSLVADTGSARGARRVALSSVVLPDEFGDRSDARAQLDSLVLARLRSAGIPVIVPETTHRVWRAIADSVGGAFDPRTGAGNSERATIIRHLTRQALMRQHGAELWLRVGVAPMRATFDGSRAQWAGVSEETGARGGVSGFLFGTSWGTIPALALLAALQDSTGEYLCACRGGIQLMSRVAHGGLEDIPFDSLLTDVVRNHRAVEIATDSAVRIATRP